MRAITIFFTCFFLCMFVSCRKKLQDQEKVIIHENTETDMKNQNAENYLRLTEEEFNFMEKVDENGLYRNKKKSKSQFHAMLLQLKKDDVFPIVLRSEKVDIIDVCESSICLGIGDIYYFNLKEMQSKKIGYEGLYILSDNDEAVKTYSQFTIPNKSSLQLLLCKTASSVYGILYSSWIICSIADGEIIDFACVSSTNALETDQLNYTNAEIDSNHNIKVKMFNEENELLSETELFLGDDGYFYMED